MKHSIKRALCALSLFCSAALFTDQAMAGNDALPQPTLKHAKVFLNEIALGSGYVVSSLKHSGEDFSVYPALARIGFNVNALFGLQQEGQATLQLAIEPFVNRVDRPHRGVEAGCAVGVRYLHAFAGPVDIFAEGSVAPMFLSIDTVEQGAAGFNFLNQIGSGLQCRLTRGTALFAGYRFRHLSHAGLADRSNDGINSNGLIAGFSWLY